LVCVQKKPRPCEFAQQKPVRMDRIKNKSKKQAEEDTRSYENQVFPSHAEIEVAIHHRYSPRVAI